ncbi:hypothetical protein C1H76_3651 [Elsinoe australis]|uniref:Uncharacterized protein n=1 Tax=Elsinoe australis TaxID=40998 RepID=A0A4U7AZE9_9PEZI|nr:hypothetical protein C1H76_3651 [Elsinoe australis]
MSSSLAATRTVLRRTAIPRNIPTHARQTLRYQSSSSTPNASGGGSHVLSGLAGGALVLGVGYGLYSFSAAGRMHSSLSKTSSQAQAYYNEATQKFQQSTPDANEAIEYLRKTAYSYAAFIPGGRGYVDTAFKDIDAVREKHGDKVDEILKETYGELQKVSKMGLSMAAVQEVLGVLEKMTKRLGSEAGDAFTSIVDNHPQLKEKVGGNLDQLKSMGEQYGPQAKEQVEQVWEQISDTLKGGLTAANIDKIKKIIDENVKKVQKLGDDAFNEGLKQAQPYLEKNPQIKKLVEENKDTLKKGDMGQLFNKVKEAAQSGDFGDLEGFVKEQAKKVQGMGENAYKEALKKAQPYLDKNPRVKELVEKNADALKKTDVSELFNKVKDAAQSGDFKDLEAYVKEQAKKVQGMGEDAWKEGLKKAQPYLDKNPKIKELVEQNQDALKNGDLKELFNRVKKSAESGDVKDLEGFVKETKNAQK